ncbi:hypothetical protein [Bradyrhizobium genosp. A]|uniref:hypothetical protein n=1 Tax=Bradyrhizobium genosp. A TaxID=83626 RepID=UPI003CFAE88D
MREKVEPVTFQVEAGELATAPLAPIIDVASEPVTVWPLRTWLAAEKVSMLVPISHTGTAASLFR